ncbi:PREDICTED: coiled-coil domain-containing protein 134-like [Ceratosolen solmsi marchali]|uniref:Coiled-coil domain-containing protein 134-like n=1 Tax=Ceratosolen solmsi marchali TaxID=326594 RepID=A0AAJ7DWF9_9HYME|nr:PREDICTED: coiled-coil domain-containing protein 134-like [Ceratosolen solmsi marchali]
MTKLTAGVFSNVARAFFLACVTTIVVAVVQSPIISAQQNVDLSRRSSAPVQEHQPVEEAEVEKSETAVDLISINRKLFKRLFLERRKEHLQAIKNLKDINNYERQYKMIDALSQKIIDVIKIKKSHLEDFTDLKLANISFSTDIEAKKYDVRDAMSSVLENIAFFGDIVLNLPDITHRILRTQPQWNSTIQWSFHFLNKTRDWLDNSTLGMVNLAMQELDIVQKEANYFNPNRIVKSNKVENNKKKEKLKRGPKITNIEL